MTENRNLGGKSRQTPIRRALKLGSELLPLVADGIQAVNREHLNYIDSRVRSDFSDSLEIDENLRTGREQEHRWDYLLGSRIDGSIVALEPHSAKTDQVSTVIKKREMAIQQLAVHLKTNVSVSKWLWVASGNVHFANTEKVRRALDQNGIEFVGTRLMRKHLLPR